MEDRATSLGCVVAYTLWTISGLLMLTSWLIWDDHLAEHLGRTGLIVCGAAVTATVRSYLVRQGRLLRAAYEMGREDRRGEVHAVR